MHHIYKVCYFPKDRFLDSWVCYNPSYALRGIMTTEPCIARRIDGELEMIIAYPFGMIADFQVCLQLIYILVKKLYALKCRWLNWLTIKHWWDVEKATSYFEPHVTREIFKVNLLQDEPTDCIIWKLEKSGLFKVRSAFHLIKKFVRKEGLWSSIGQQMKTLWRAV